MGARLRQGSPWTRRSARSAIRRCSSPPASEFPPRLECVIGACAKPPAKPGQTSQASQSRADSGSASAAAGLPAPGPANREAALANGALVAAAGACTFQCRDGAVKDVSARTDRCHRTSDVAQLAVYDAISTAFFVLRALFTVPLWLAQSHPHMTCEVGDVSGSPAHDHNRHLHTAAVRDRPGVRSRCARRGSRGSLLPDDRCLPLRARYSASASNRRCEPPRTRGRRRSPATSHPARRP